MQFSSNRFQKRKVNSGAWSFLNFLTAWSLCRDDSSRIRNLMRYLRLYQDAKRPEWNPDFMNKIEKKIKHCPPTHSNILILLTLLQSQINSILFIGFHVLPVWLFQQGLDGRISSISMLGFSCFVLGRNDSVQDLRLNFIHKIAIVLWTLLTLM